MPTPRYKLVDAKNPMHYHLVSRCVRRAFLCGNDRYAQRDYSHRKTWIVSRLRHLARFFSVDIQAYAVMSNHLHLVVHYDPNQCLGWSDEEVARRWVGAFPSRSEGELSVALQKARESKIASDKSVVSRLRSQLGSLSFFMKYLKQNIARRANKEDGVTGHFWEQRFYSAALLSSRAVIACMAYVDLNPIRAKTASSLEELQNTSAKQRLADARDVVLSGKGPIHPVHGKVGDRSGLLAITNRSYLQLLEHLCERFKGEGERAELSATNPWLKRFKLLSRLQRAYGSTRTLRLWLQKRGMRELEIPF